VGKQHQGRLILTERDRRTLKRIVSKYRRTTAEQVTVELNVLLEDPVSTKTVRRELHISSIHGRAAIAKPLITESNAQMRKRWCPDHKTWTSGSWKSARERKGQMGRLSCYSLRQEEFSFGEHPRKPTIRNFSFQQ
jgi:hypothetical protein